MKSSCIKFAEIVLSLMLLTGNVLAQNGPPGGTSLIQQVAALQAAVATLQATVAAQQTTITELSSRLQYVSLVGKDMYITGANLHIVNGTGKTVGQPFGTVTGLGNLIVGYNESRGGCSMMMTGAARTISWLGCATITLRLGGS